MKLCPKRVHCPACGRLVKGREHRVEGEANRIEIMCSRCGKLLHVGNGVTWKYLRDA